MRIEWPLPDLPATEKLGEALARSCPWDEQRSRVVYLRGELGAGKTTLAAALLHSMGVSEPVRSPSYSLIETYLVPQGLVVHLDLYRLQGNSELEPIGLREYLEGRTLLLIEWPERGAGALPAPDLDVQLWTVPARGAAIEARGRPGEAWLTKAQGGSITQIRN